MKNKLISIEQTSGFDRYEDVSFPENGELSQESFKRFEGNRTRLHIKSKFTNYPDFSYAIDHSINPTIDTFKLQESNDQFELFDNSGFKIDKKYEFFKHSIHKGHLESKFKISFPKSTTFYGLGDKSGSQKLNNKKFQFWNTDSFGYDENRDPLYKTIPIFYGINSNRFFGFFLDNTFKGEINFIEENNGIEFNFEGGDISLWFWEEENFPSCVQNYTLLTGLPDFPPAWALGFHQCRWSYFPEERLKYIANQFREKGIPCDALYLDIDYMKDYMVFTVDEEKFPDLKKLNTTVKNSGFELVLMIDPGISADEKEPIFIEGKANDHYCKHPNGELMLGPVWPPLCVWPDYTKESTREWWGKLYEEFYSDFEIGGFWNDMNEPAVFKVINHTFSNQVQHHFEGFGADHKQIHNVYGMLMTKASYEGLIKIRKEKRPFLITRATYSGGQKFGFTWTGDNVGTWNHLAIAHRQMVRLSISGFSLSGSDIGGFSHRPTGELYLRWMQLAVLHPLMRVHSMGTHMSGTGGINEYESHPTDHREPWEWPTNYQDHINNAIKWRYKIFPILYSALKKLSENGLPLLTPIQALFPEAPDWCENQVFFGENILVAPILEKGLKTKKIFFPESKSEWYQFSPNIFSNLIQSPENYNLDIHLDSFPWFVKGGTALLLYPEKPFINHSFIDLPELHVFIPTQNGEWNSSWYEDEGDGFEFRNGNYKKTNFSLKRDQFEITISISSVGHYITSYQKFRVVLHGNQKLESLEIDSVSSKFSSPLYLEKKPMAIFSMNVNSKFLKFILK
jgi:alpha-glucosidase